MVDSNRSVSESAGAVVLLWAALRHAEWIAPVGRLRDCSSGAGEFRSISARDFPPGLGARHLWPRRALAIDRHTGNGRPVDFRRTGVGSVFAQCDVADADPGGATLHDRSPPLAVGHRCRDYRLRSAADAERP